MAVEPFCIVIIVRHLITYRLAPIVSDLKASVHDTICTLPQPKKSHTLIFCLEHLALIMEGIFCGILLIRLCNVTTFIYVQSCIHF